LSKVPFLAVFVTAFFDDFFFLFVLLLGSGVNEVLPKVDRQGGLRRRELGKFFGEPLRETLHQVL
jgi:hypothetical protein